MIKNSSLKREFLLLLFLIAALEAVGVATCVDEETAPVSMWTRRLIDPKGNSIAGATIEVHDSGRMVFVTKSDSGGKFSIKGIPKGDYWVTIDASGFIHYRYHLITSARGRNVPIIALRPSSECHDRGPIKDNR